jgi:16S rRNA (cytosine1402-N4)-methyltransferase
MHKPVLLKEAIDGLALKPGEIFLDGTFGAGGHSREARKRLGDMARIIALDQDPSVAKSNPDFEIRALNFRHLDKVAEKPDAILLDIGFSSDQLESGRGFSFLKDEPLDMRMSQKGITAADILNSWDESAIELILRGFGEERYSGRIAREIATRRETAPFERTTDLLETIENAVPIKYLHGKIHPATRTFQALRIAVNEELAALEEGLAKGFELLNTGGRLAVITFHSLEDRIVKNFFRELAAQGRGELQNKKPIIPTEKEIKQNPRARSAKLRIIKKNV